MLRKKEVEVSDDDDVFKLCAVLFLRDYLVFKIRSGCEVLKVGHLKLPWEGQRSSFKGLEPAPLTNRMKTLLSP